MEFERYDIHSELLKPWVKFIWYFGTQDIVEINNKLLPTNNIDFILNDSAPIKYLLDEQIVDAGSFHFRRINDRHSTIIQNGKLRVFGISLYPYSPYMFLDVPLSTIKEAVADLGQYNENLMQNFDATLKLSQTVPNTVRLLEKNLEEILDLSKINLRQIYLIKSYIQDNMEESVITFCNKNKIATKTFERVCLKYTGYTPKALQKIGRFQTATNQIIMQRNINGGLKTSYLDYYYDQAHFIKEFKNYTGLPPSKFLETNSSIKETVKDIKIVE